MPRAAAPALAALRARLAEASSGLAGVGERRMFGCDGFFAGGVIYALVWKTGRIALKLPAAADYEALLRRRGAEPWTAGSMTMASWVLVPDALAADDKQLAAWVARAHAQARAQAEAQPQPAPAGAKKSTSPAKTPKTSKSAAATKSKTANPISRSPRSPTQRKRI